MRKIIDQQLDGSIESAKEKVIYTWQKDEIAWYFDTTWCDVFKVKFTGECWLSGNKWNYNKIYQFEYLDCSGNHDLKKKGLNDNGISHGEERLFYTLPEEALEKGYEYIETNLKEAQAKYNKDNDRLEAYHFSINLKRT